MVFGINEVLKNRKAYFNWRLERIKNIEKRFPEIFDVKNKKVLDVGCGPEAPLAYYLSKIKKAKVYAGEINSVTINSAKRFAKNVKISKFYAEKIPFKDNEFDIVYLFDILEHVNDPTLAIKEAKRVVKKGGLIFLDFSPYYAYPTGHHLYSLGFPFGFLPFQLIPKNIVKWIIFNSKVKIKDSPKFIFNQFATLNKLSIKKFKGIVKKLELKLKDEYSLIILPHEEINLRIFGNIPLLNEVITQNYSCIVEKN